MFLSAASTPLAFTLLELREADISEVDAWQVGNPTRNSLQNERWSHTERRTDDGGEVENLTDENALTNIVRMTSALPF